jgi:cytochrome b561
MALLGALLAGFACGAALGYFGLQHTKFEATAQGRFYTPHTYIGLFVTALFLSRIVFRFLAVYLDPHAAAQPNQNLFDAYHKSSLTWAILGVLIGYYVLFYSGILRRSRGLALPATDTANP